jgi:hypothetical protein
MDFSSLKRDRMSGRLVVMMSADHRDGFFKRCKKMGLTPSEVTRKLIENFMEQDNGKTRKRAAKHRASVRGHQ